jgi:hypothetical protein
MNMLCFGDVRPDDLQWFTREGGDGETSGAANAIHLFRLCQLSMEALMHVQSFLMKSIQAKEGAVAAANARAADREERDAATIAALRKQLASLQKERVKMQAKIDGFERAGARIQPVTYLPAASTTGKPLQQPVYPGEVYPCALCGTAFLSAHFLTQHYTRRHPGFVHPAQTIVERPQQPGIQQADVDRQIAQMRDALQKQMSEHYEKLSGQRKQQDLQALLTRLTALEAMMRGQFAAATVPAHMLESQQAIYNALLKEIEQIKADIARDAQLQIEKENQQPHWHIAPKTPAKSPLRPSQQQKEEEEKEPHRPTPLAVMSPTNALSSPPTPLPLPLPPSPQPERARPSTAVLHLSRADRLRAVLLRRIPQTYAPFQEFPDIRSRYPEEDWMPSARAEYHELEIVLGELAKEENQDQLKRIEEEMHQQETAKETYNDIYDLLDSYSDALPPELELVQQDAALGERWAFLPIWARLIEEKEARMGGRREKEEEERRRREDEAKKASDDAKQHALLSEQMRQEQRRQLLQYEMQQADRMRAQQLQASTSPTAALSPSITTPLEPTPFDRMDVPSTTLGSLDVLSPMNMRSPTNAGPEGGAGGQEEQMYGEQTPYTPLVRDYSGQGIMTRTPLPSTRPEGFDRRNDRLQQIPTIMPQTPAHLGTQAKTPLSIFTPSVRQREAEAQAQHQSVPASAPAQIPPQLGGNFSPSSSLNSSAASSLGASERYSQSFAGSGIMTRSGAGGLTHISEGGSIDESRNVNARGEYGQEEKYGEVPSSPPAPIIPRTDLDDEFEALVSPRKVLPREKPSIVVAATPNAAAASKFMATPGAVTPATTRGFSGTVASMPAASPASTNTLQLPSAQTNLRPINASTPMSTMATGSQPGAFSYAVAPTPTPGAPVAATPGPGFTPHTHSVAGHSFVFGPSVGAVEEEEDDEFPMSTDAQEHMEETRRQDEVHASLRREEEEALGLPLSPSARSVMPMRGPQVVQQQQPAPIPATQPVAQPSSTFASSLNDTVEETIVLPEPRRAGVPTVTRVASAQQNEEKLPMVMRMESTQEIAPTVTRVQSTQDAPPLPFAARPTVIASTPSPVSAMSQPGLQEISPPPPVSSNTLVVPGGNDVRAFAPSPVASPAASFSSSTTVQPFVASPMPSPLPPAQAPGPSIPVPEQSHQPTFLSEYHDDEFDDFDDQPAPVPASSAAVQPVEAAPVPTPTSATAAAKPGVSVPWMKAVNSDDEFASEASDDDEKLHKKQGLETIQPGSVSNARAALLGSGFFMSPMNVAGGTPTMSQLKSARAARLGETEGAATVAEPALSPMPATMAKPKPAAQRKNRTIQSFQMTKKDDY